MKKKREPGPHSKGEESANFVKMKLTILLFLICILQSFGGVYSQSVKYDISLEKGTLEEVFKIIEQKGEYTFLYSIEDIDKIAPIKIDVKQAELKEILTICLAKTDLTYEINHQLVIIKSREEKKEKITMITVKGIVKDEAGEPLPGVSVILKGSHTGSTTNIKGEFQLNVPEQDTIVLTFSFVGMKSQEVMYKGKPMSVVLKEDIQSVEEVVITGYQKIDRKLFTGAASKVDMKDIYLPGEPDITKALEGQVAGVSIQNVSSTFGSAPKLRIRGASSIYGNQKPLWVIDGVVLEDAVNVSMDELNSGNIATIISSGVAGLNTDDIASLQILKDVSATALYGARAMNGVIVITTKKGRQGKMSVNYSTNISIKPIPSYDDYNILNSGEQMSVNRELYEKGWINIAQTPSAIDHGPYGKMFDLIAKNEIAWVDNNNGINTFLRKYETANTNWFKELFRTGIQQQHTLSIAGGGTKNTFYASISYLHDDGWTIADKVDRYTALLKGTFDITKQLTVTASTNMSFRKQRLSGASQSTDDVNGVDRYTGRIERNFDNNPFLYALQTSRAIRCRDENGNLEFFRKNYTDYNIVDELSKNRIEATVRDMSFTADINYNITSSFSLSGKVSARYYLSKLDRKVHENSNEAKAYRAGTGPDDSGLIQENNGLLFQKPGDNSGIKYSILPEGGIYETYCDEMLNYYLNANANWNPRIGSDHMFTFLLGTEIRYINRDKDWNYGYGHFFDAGNVSKPSANYMEYLESVGGSYFGKAKGFDRFAAFFLNYGYSFQGKYTFNGTIRYDGSNRLGHARSARWLPTWNISGKWAVKEEDFMNRIEWLSQLNLRLTYGLNASLGNATNSTLLARTRVNNHPFHPSFSELEIDIVSLGNRDLTWEKQHEFNAGIDAGLWENRLNLIIDYYNRKAFDLIGAYPSSGVGGERLKLGNIADMHSHGIELTLTCTPAQTQKFRWNFNINYAYHHSKIVKLISQDWVGRAVSTYGVPVLNGPVRGIYSSRFAGLDDHGVPMFFNKNDEQVYYLKLQSYDWSDFVYSGNLEPTSNAGMQHTFTFGNLSLSALFTGQFGHKKRVMQNYSYGYYDSEALPSKLKNRWRVKGDEKITSIPAILDKDYYNRSNETDISTAYNLYGMSDLWLADASFIRLKNLSLSYSLPKKWMQKLSIDHVNLGFSATNVGLLWLADKEKLGGEDPEFSWSGGTIMPISRQYVFTLNIGF